MKIGAKIHIFNVEMREARKRLSMSQAELAELIGETIKTVQFIETLKQPNIRLDRIKDILQNIANILNIDFDILFPEDYLFALQNKYLPNERNIIISRDISILSLPASTQFMQLPAPDEVIEIEQMKKQVIEILETLPVMEQNIIKYLYGFEDGENHTLKDAANKFCKSEYYIRNAQFRALAELRRQKTINKIKDYL